MITDPQSLLVQLEQSDWCKHCGQAVVVPSVRVLSSWKELARLAADDETEELLLEHANRIGDDVQARDMDAYRGWNDFVVAVRPSIATLVERKLSGDSVGRPVSQAVIDHVRWIVLHAAIELRDAAFTEMRAYVTLAQWLTRGHLPAAWAGGIFPVGYAVIY